MSARFRNAFRRLLRGKNGDKDAKSGFFKINIKTLFKKFIGNCTVTLSRPLTATTSMRPDDLRPFLSPTHSSSPDQQDENEAESCTELVEKV